MRRIHLFALLLPCIWLSTAVAQQPKKPAAKRNTATAVPRPEQKKYPSLLWEITGNGLKKPSYLFGTMHVSDKLAFHLGDSFYNAIKNVEVVALETNPEDWQDNYSQSTFYKNSRDFDYERYAFMDNEGPSDALTLTSFAIDDYGEAVKASLAVEPSMINGMLYRTYGSKMDDFEEDTYLDLYIFQTGKKLGKRLAGVENFEESEKLVIEAYRDMMKDRNRKRKSYDFESMYTNPKKVEDAYRKGDLDVLDSLEMLTVFSDAFQEKFMYKRNEIQTRSIDSIIKKSTLFVGVGAAHLPGKRGVIEMLRRMGYTLRPVKMDERNSVQKDMIDKTRSTNTFATQTSDDGFYQVNIPGKKFYRFTDWLGMDVVQYADMVNGAYYVVTRIKTNSLAWGHSSDLIHKKIDSLLYENIPGKILKKTPITRNGYKGWEIQNRTRRGDHQRYNIYITPFEVIIFKMSGNGDYIADGDEAQQFFGSVKMKENEDASWVSYQPPTGGFSVQMPHEPSILKNVNYGSNRLEFAAFDKKEGVDYLVMKSNLHNYSYAEEDTFELNLMGESYAFSSFIDKETSRKFSTVNGYPALDCKYLHKDGSFSTVKYVIRGPLYYTVVAHHKTDNNNVKRFMESFAITPFIYQEVKLRTDTAMKFTVQSPLPLIDKEKEDALSKMLEMMRMYEYDDDDEPVYEDLFGGLKSRFIGNDTIGEKVLVTYNTITQYGYFKDTADLWKSNGLFEDERDSTLIYRVDKKQAIEGGGWIREMQVSDTGSSRLILSKIIYKEGHLFTVTALTDTLSPRSAFLDKFFSSFQPADTLKKVPLFTRKTEQFFNEYFSADTVVAKKARKYMYTIVYDSLDVPLLKKAIDRVGWSTKNYLDVKKHFISELSGLKDSTITPYLRQLYWKVKDSADLQNAILQALLNQKTLESFTAFKDLIVQEPPIETDDITPYYGHSYFRMPRIVSSYTRITSGNWDYDYYSGKWSQLYDTLSLAKKVFPDLLQLMNVDDYKKDVLDLLTVLVDSGYLKAQDYESQFSKIYLDGKQLMKKQVASEEKDNIEKVSRKDKTSVYGYDDDEEDQVLETGNDNLEKYAILLMPFYDKNPGVASFFEQLLKTRDRQLLYDGFMLMVRNNKPVPDSLFEKFAKLDQYRLRLYNQLKKINKLDKFPTAWKTQKQMARAMFTGGGYSTPDSVVYLDKLPVTYQSKKGWVYFFKYRQMRDDTYWQLASVGMQPENQNEIDTENTDFSENEDRKLDNNKSEKEQMEKMLKEMVYSKRISAYRFYSARSYSIYKTYLSEMVKSQRYND